MGNLSQLLKIFALSRCPLTQHGHLRNFIKDGNFGYPDQIGYKQINVQYRKIYFLEQTYLHGSSLNFVTPTDETRTNLSSVEGNAKTRFLTPSQSSNGIVR